MVERVKGWQIRWYSLSVEGPAVTEDFWTATSMALVVSQTTTPGKMSPKGRKEVEVTRTWREGGRRKEEEKQAGEGAPGVGVSRRRWDRASSRVIQ